MPGTHAGLKLPLCTVVLFYFEFEHALSCTYVTCEHQVCESPHHCTHAGEAAPLVCRPGLGEPGAAEGGVRAGSGQRVRHQLLRPQAGAALKPHKTSEKSESGESVSVRIAFHWQQ